MPNYLPIIYVRGYAATENSVNEVVDLPYYGFNLGSTRIRSDADGEPAFRIFESPLVRLMKDHNYQDVFARVNENDKVEIFRNADSAGQPIDVKQRSLWIYRYYDPTSTTIGNGDRDEIETLAERLGILVDHVIDRTGAPQVYLVAHSMGGLICRSLIQRTLGLKASDKIARLFTYATPHGGIHFRSGLGFLEKVRDALGFYDSDTFGPKRMKQYLGFPDDWPDDKLHEIGDHYPVKRVFSLIGTTMTTIWPDWLSGPEVMGWSKRIMPL